jgi:hypothetical protein
MVSAGIEFKGVRKMSKPIEKHFKETKESTRFPLLRPETGGVLMIENEAVEIIEVNGYQQVVDEYQEGFGDQNLAESLVKDLDCRLEHFLGEDYRDKYFECLVFNGSDYWKIDWSEVQEPLKGKVGFYNDKGDIEWTSRK